MRENTKWGIGAVEALVGLLSKQCPLFLIQVRLVWILFHLGFKIRSTKILVDMFCSSGLAEQVSVIGRGASKFIKKLKLGNIYSEIAKQKEYLRLD